MQLGVMGTNPSKNGAIKAESKPSIKKVSGIKQNAHKGNANFNIKNQKPGTITKVQNVDQVTEKHITSKP